MHTEVASVMRAAARRICEGNTRETTFSCRVRLARNISSVPFPNRAQPKHLEEILALARRTAEDIGNGEPASLLALARLTKLEQEALVESHLISRQLLMNDRFAALMISHSAACSALVNEEDHFRVQAISGGLDLENTLLAARRLEARVACHAEFAHLNGLGYLTACPTNVGTGLRVSVMMRLPALFFSRGLANCLKRRIRRNMAVRGIYGEGSGSLACFLQISNQATAGMSDDEIVREVARVANEMAGEELDARASMMARCAFEIEDLVFRAAAILRVARTISSDEAMDRLSQVRLGLDLGLIRGVDADVIDQLTMFVRPASLQVLLGEVLPPRERDMRRASLIREQLHNITTSEGMSC